MKNLKQQILYSDLIVTLISTQKVLAIYLGGSRLLNLDSPESDYDIIVITKDNSLNNYQRKELPIKDIHAHVHIHSIKNVISLIKHPEGLNGYQNCLILIDTLLCKDEHIIYTTHHFNKLKHIVMNNKDALVTLCLETRLIAIQNSIISPIKQYDKKYYHYLLMHYLLKNFIQHKELYLEDSQIKILKDFKTTKVLPPVFYSILKTNYLNKYFYLDYNYENIYKELIKYE